jgi:hypothetical protein
MLYKYETMGTGNREGFEKLLTYARIYTGGLYE